MDARLHRAVVDRLDAQGDIDEAQWLVLAACEGPDALRDALGGDTSALTPPTAVPATAEPQAVYLRAILVEGFRGVGPAARLELEPGPGLTLVVGRNGTGKSSFAEGLELCLTGENRRWAGRSAVWLEGWRNLHNPTTCRVAAELVVDGVPGGVRVSRAWSADEAIGAGAPSVAGHPSAASLDDLGWSEAISSMRPFLSYNELARMFEIPSQMHDALAGILGLDDLTTVGAMLKAERSPREQSLKAARERLSPLLPRLGDADERAAACRNALAAKQWDLDAVEGVLGGALAGGALAGELAVLRALAELRPPDREVAASELRDAADARDALAGTDAASAGRIADLLERGVVHHDHEGDAVCPICGEGRLDGAWRASAQSEIAALRTAAATATAAAARVATALQAAGRAFDTRPASLGQAAEVGLDATRAGAAWDDWLRGRDIADPRAMADHIDRTAPTLDAALSDLRAAAAAERDRRDDAWRPLARDLRDWVAVARPALAAAAAIPTLKTAEAWVKDAIDAIRRERFAPISAATAAHWQKLRQGSSVVLGEIDLAGSATHRRVDIAVAIDGQDGAALGVMSQGELCSLALCMFLPRAAHPESPFRFVVIDDPVQSMDPAKVDGLSRVLEGAAEDRQVVVFTHDDRLAEAIRRLRISATVVEVSRRPGSVVELSAGLDPVEARLDDARAAARDSDLPHHIAARVVPGLCRQAIEAGCSEAVRRRRLARGDSHADVESLLREVAGLREWVALALFDDGGKESQGKVLSRLKNDGSLGPKTADAFRDCNSGAHGAYIGSLADLVRDAGRLARALSQRA